MNPLAGLLDQEPVVVTVGAALLADAVESQGAKVERTDWRPPLPGTGEALAVLASDSGTGRANTTALERLLAVRPQLVDVVTAREVIPALEAGTFLHAGPPVTWNECSGPLRGALIGAMRYEGLADSIEQATARGSQLALDPCHHHRAAGPMAGVVSPTMPVAVITDAAGDGVAYATLNEGLGKVLRYGAFSEVVLERLRWMEEVMAPVLGKAIEMSGGIDIRALLAEALHMGDEGHNRNKAGSVLFTKNLAPFIVKATDDAEVASKVISTLGDNALSVLNPVMAACKGMVDVAHNIEGSTVVSVMARNGTDFGIRVSGLGDRWFTAPVAIPQGLYFPGFTADDSSGDIGDSTITETAGIGGFAMASAPAIVTFVSGTPRDALNATLEMYEICYTEHKYFTIPPLDFRGTPTGIDIRKVVETGITPRVNTGIAHKDAGVGQVGAGLVRPPMEMFEEALVAYAEQYGY